MRPCRTRHPAPSPSPRRPPPQRWRTSARLRATRWPDTPEETGWSLGTDLAYLRELVTYWAEAVAAPAGPMLPLTLSHGWPDSFSNAGLRERIRRQGDALCAFGGPALSEAELDTLVPTLLLSNGKVLVDQPVQLRDIVAGLAEVELPGHTKQLLALLPDSAGPKPHGSPVSTVQQ